MEFLFTKYPDNPAVVFNIVASVKGSLKQCDVALFEDDNSKKESAPIHSQRIRAPQYGITGRKRVTVT